MLLLFVILIFFNPWSFKILLGNCYGHRPIPRLIPENEFELLLAKLAQNEEGIRFLSQWFWKDDNSVPPTYVLQPISTHFPYYSDIGSEVCSSHDSDVINWQLTEARILRLLRTAALQASEEGELSTEQKQKYFKSGLQIALNCVFVDRIQAEIFHKVIKQSLKCFFPSSLFYSERMGDWTRPPWDSNKQPACCGFCEGITTAEKERRPGGAQQVC